jgi:hypothetical protein
MSNSSGKQREEEGEEEEKDAKALMVISSLCPILVEGVMRGLRLGIGPKGAEALSFRSSVHP